MKIFFVISVYAFFCKLSYSSPSECFKNCPKNMKLFPDDTGGFCDCEDTFLYHSEHDSCYDAYRQGPCSSRQYFILPPGETNAKCEKNPCKVDGMVPFKEKCHFLWKSGDPCNNETYLGINSQFQIECNSSKYLGSIEDLRSSKSCGENSYLLPTDDENKNHICKCKETSFFSKKIILVIKLTDRALVR